MSEKTKIDTILKRIRDSMYIILLGVVIVLMISNWFHVDAFMERILATSTDITIGDYFSVTSSTSPEPERVGKMQAFYRIKDGLRISEVKFDDSGNGYEFVELQALQAVNLTGGFIGDANKVLYLGDRNLRLSKSDIVRIYTFVKTDDPKAYVSKMEQQLKRVAVLASVVYGKPRESGIFKNDPGEGDRIVVFDREHRPMIDAHYWWLTLPDRK